MLDRFGNDLNVRCWYYRVYLDFGRGNGVDGEVIFLGGED